MSRRKTDANHSIVVFLCTFAFYKLKKILVFELKHYKLINIKGLSYLTANLPTY